jgi:RecG-like helicase
VDLDREECFTASCTHRRTSTSWMQAIRRLKFEELFFIQLQLSEAEAAVAAQPARQPSSTLTWASIFNSFYKEHLPFEPHRCAESGW